MILTYIGDTKVYEVKNFKIISEHVLEIIPAEGVKIPAQTTGFTLQEGTTPACNYSAYKTIYRTIEDNIQFSDDGSVWTEPVSDIKIGITWNDNDNADGGRPNAVKVDVLVNGEKLETVTLNVKNNWSKEYIDIPESQIYTITAKDISGYTKIERGTYIIYSDANIVENNNEDEISKDEQIVQLTELVNQLSERIKALETQ